MYGRPSRLPQNTSPRPTFPPHSHDQIGWDFMLNLWYHFQEVIDFYLCFINLAAYLFLSYAVLRYRRLRISKPSHYLLAMSLGTFLQYTAVPTILLIVNLFFKLGVFLKKYRCYVYEIDESARFLTASLSMGLVIDRCLELCKPGRHRTLQKWGPILASAVAGSRYAYLVLNACYYGYDRNKYLSDFDFASYWILAGVVVGGEILTARSKPGEERSVFRLIGVYQLGSFLPAVIWEYFWEMSSATLVARTVLHVFRVVPNCLAHSGGIVVTWMLLKRDKRFRIAYRNITGWDEEDVDVDLLEISSDEESSSGSYTISGDSEGTDVTDGEIFTEDKSVSQVPLFI